MSSRLAAIAVGVALLTAAPPAWGVLDIEDAGPMLSPGGFALRVTNAGILGNAFFDQGLSSDPSFELRPGSGLEGLRHVELWVGAESPTGLGHRVSGGPLLEWRPTLDPSDRVRTIERGALGTLRLIDDDGDGRVDEERLDGVDEDGDGEIDEDLATFAQQTLTAEYSDDRPEARLGVYEGGESHEPLHVKVHQQAFGWSTPGYEGIAGLSFVITNTGARTLHGVRIGLFADLDSRRRNDRAGHLNDRVSLESYETTVSLGAHGLTAAGACWNPFANPCPLLQCTRTLRGSVPVVHDRDPELPYVSIVPLDHTTDPLALIPPAAGHARAPGAASFRHAIFTRGRLPGEGGPPIFDEDRYRALAGDLPSTDLGTVGDLVVLVSCGPFASLAPGQSLTFDAALVIAATRESLMSAIGRAAALHHGFAVNLIPDSIPPAFPDEWNAGTSGRTGHEACIRAPTGMSFVFDPHCPEKFRGSLTPGNPVATEPPPDAPVVYTDGECIWTDADCDACTGIGGNETIVRWNDAGDAPSSPEIDFRSGDRRITVLWNNRPEIIDSMRPPVGNDFRFVGYRVYKLANWNGRQSLMPARPSWALIAAIGDRREFGELPLSTVTDSTLDYESILGEQRLYGVGRYAVTDTMVFNGFDYSYVVTTVVERIRVVGTASIVDRLESPFVPRFTNLVRAHAAARDRPGVWVVPNPFRAREAWDRPPVAGDMLTRHVDFMGLPRARSTIRIWTVAGDHVATVDHDGTSGDGQASWDLVSRNGQDVESGIYLFTVHSTLGVERGRFVIIR